MADTIKTYYTQLILLIYIKCIKLYKGNVYKTFMTNYNILCSIVVVRSCKKEKIFY